MPYDRSQMRFVLGMETRHPLKVEIVCIIQNVGTNGVALKRALAMPEITDSFAVERVGIVRSDSIPHITKDLRKYCDKIGLNEKSAQAAFVLAFAQELIRSLDTIQAEARGEEVIPISESRWGKGRKS